MALASKWDVKVHFCPDNCQAQAPSLFEKMPRQIYFLFSILLLQHGFWAKHAGDSHPGRRVRRKSLSYKHSPAFNGFSTGHKFV